MNVPALATAVTTEQETPTAQPTTASWQTLTEQFNYHLHELRKLSREMAMASNGASIDDAAEAMQAYFEMKYQTKLARMLARTKCDGPTSFCAQWGPHHGKCRQHESDKMLRKMHKKMARHGGLHPGTVPTPAPF